MRRVASQDALRPGTVLSGRIRVERVVGQGSMGVVLEATDLPLQRRVAIKVMLPDRSHLEEARKRFLREARAAVRLSSEHVTRLLDVGELDDGTPYLVMEYLVGYTLEAVLVRDGPPEIDVAVDWVLQALDGVADAHRTGLVHRDLKPENLFLCERPDRPPIVKVLDFGTVKDLVTKATKLTRRGATMGSPAYMPPEQVRAEEIDPRADVWAMGVTLYELITGELPFGGESVPQTLAAILRDDPTPIRKRKPAAPPELEALIACALSKDRAGRYASATEMLGALSIIRARMPSTTRMTKTVRLGHHQDSRVKHPDELADTTDMQRAGVEADASTIRPRVIVNQMMREAENQTVHVAQTNAKTTDSRSHRTKLVFAAIAAVVIGGIGGAIVSQRHGSLLRKSIREPTSSAGAALPSVTPRASTSSAPVAGSKLADPTGSSSAPLPVASSSTAGSSGSTSSRSVPTAAPIPRKVR